MLTPISMIIHQVEQKSEAWHDLRKQHFLTASEAQAIGNNGKGLETLIWNKLSEKYSTAERENFTNKDTERGNDLEGQARSIYQLETGSEVKEVGFVTDENISPIGGASPDGIVEQDGLLEIKCFQDGKHFKYIVEGLSPESQYAWQMQMQMLFTGRQWCDFVAYNPNFKQSLLVMRVFADKTMQDAIKEGLESAEKLVKIIENKLK